VSFESSSDFLLNFSGCDVNGEEKHVYRFKSFQLDVAERQLLNNGVSVPLMPKVFDVLVVLVDRSGHLVEKDELLRIVWADSFVEEANIARIIHALRKILGEDDNGTKFIETVAKKGYRFVAEVREKSETIAILPFKPLVAENRNAALELGMADTLITKLGGGEEIAVRPFSAIRRYNSVEQDSLIAGRELNVDAVLDGTIQTSGERIRISAKLLRVGDGMQLWAGQFDEKFTDIFTVQDSISERVATALKIRLGNAEKKRPTENVEAYQLYMKGRYHALNLTRAETDKGIAYFKQAMELDPNYALAYVGLSQSYLPMALTSGLPSWEVVPKAKAAALRAIEIDETLAEAHAALGFTIFWYDWDWQAAEKEYLRALELDPNSSEAHVGYAHLLSNTARHEQAFAEIKLSRELDPVALLTGALEGQFLFFAGRSDEALDRLSKTIDLNPNFWLSHLFISDVYTDTGMYAEAVAASKKAGELSGNSQSQAYRAYALARSGKPEEARSLLDELLKLSNERYVPPYNFAVVYNGLGESDKALDCLEKAFAEKNVLMVFLKVEPKWNNLRSEPRFINLMKRMEFE
jgi:DNA-binding winged helix-turn-helix (wHTH) protein/Tfp pilus assembly protein PilF